MLTPMSKYYCCEICLSVTDAAIQIHGGEGVSDPELTRLMGMARALRIADGPDEVHLQTIARLEVKESNAPAVNLYRSLGYQVASREEQLGLYI